MGVVLQGPLHRHDGYGYDACHAHTEYGEEQGQSADGGADLRRKDMTTSNLTLQTAGVVCPQSFQECVAGTITTKAYSNISFKQSRRYLFAFIFRVNRLLVMMYVPRTRDDVLCLVGFTDLNIIESMRVSCCRSIQNTHYVSVEHSISSMPSSTASICPESGCSAYTEPPGKAISVHT